MDCGSESEISIWLWLSETVLTSRGASPEFLVSWAELSHLLWHRGDPNSCADPTFILGILARIPGSDREI